MDFESNAFFLLCVLAGNFAIGVLFFINAREGSRTLTPCDGDQILSLACLPIPPLWHNFLSIMFSLRESKKILWFCCGGQNAWF